MDHPTPNPSPKAGNSATTSSRLALEKFRRYVDQMDRERDAQPPLVLARALDRLSVLVEKLLERAT